jgi:hypothetical protein
MDNKEKINNLYDAGDWDGILELVNKIKTGSTKALLGLKRNCINVIQYHAGYSLSIYDGKAYTSMQSILESFGFYVIDCNLVDFKKKVKKKEINLDTYKDFVIFTSSHSIIPMLNELNLPNNLLIGKVCNNNDEYMKAIRSNQTPYPIQKSWYKLVNVNTGSIFEFDSTVAAASSRDERIDSIFED